MRRIYRWFTLLLPVILLVGACQPLLAPVARYPRLELQGHVSGATLTVAVQGDYAYLGFSYEFVVLDIADRRNPHWVAALPIFTNAIALAGGYAYVVGKGGFTVVNIADPIQPQLLASLGSQETAVGVVLAAVDCIRWILPIPPGRRSNRQSLCHRVPSILPPQAAISM